MKARTAQSTAEQLSSWSISITITRDKSLNVLVFVDSLDDVSDSFPLISNEQLEASTTVKQGSVEIEHNGADIRQHLFYTPMMRTTKSPRSRPFCGLMVAIGGSLPQSDG